MEYNYFYSVPLPSDASSQLSDLLQRIRSNTSCTTAAGFDEKLLQNSSRFHITLAVLKLYSDKKRQLAK